MSERMTDAETRAVLILGDAWNAILRCGVSGPEPAAHIHALQHAVMAQVARRMHPDIFRQSVDIAARNGPDVIEENASRVSRSMLRSKPKPDRCCFGR